MKKTILLFASFIGLTLFSCKKSSDSTTPTQPTVGNQIKTTNINYSVARTTALANIAWTAGFANPDVIKFEAKTDNTQIEYKSTNTAQIDLMSSVGLTFGGFSIPAGTYKEIEVKLELEKNGTVPVLELRGTFTSGAITLPVVLDITQSIELKTEQHDVTISSDYSFVAVTTLDLSAITSGITASMLLGADLTGGSVVISSSSNVALYNIVLAHLQNERHHCEFESHHK